MNTSTTFTSTPQQIGQPDPFTPSPEETTISSWSTISSNKASAIAHIAPEIIAAKASQADSIAYITTFFAQVAIPHSDPTRWKTNPLKKDQIYTRTNGDLTIRLAPMGGEGHPYGSSPRYLLAWVQTEITRRKYQLDATAVELGKNPVSFLQDKLKLQWGAGKRGNATHIKQQAFRLFTSRIAIQYLKEPATGRHGHKNLDPIADDDDLDFFRNWKNPQADFQWPTVLHLNPNFAKQIRAHGFPFDWRIIRAIGESPLGIDLYWCLLRWWHYIESQGDGRSQHITWSALMTWFGPGYADTPSGRFGFKKKAIIQLQNIRTLTAGKLTLGPSDRGDDGIWIHRSRHALIMPE